MIIEKTGNIFLSQADYITIPVNTVGIAGAGLAKQFALEFPVYLGRYRDLCSTGELDIGRVRALEVGHLKSVVLFPTKRHWRNPSILHDILLGLVDLSDKLKRGVIRGSVALPRLGCGLGELDWGRVYPLIKEVFENTQHNIEVYVK